MTNISNEKKQEIIEAIEEKGAKRSCPRCEDNNFTLIDGYFKHVLHQKLGETDARRQHIYSIGIICNMCGYIIHHELGILIDTKEEKGKKRGRKGEEK